MLPIVLIFTLFLARFSTNYDSRNSKGKYFIIKNDKLAKLFIEKATFGDKGRYSLKKDRNKMSVVGFVFYLSNILIILLTIIFLFIPDIPCKPLVIDATKIYLYADTLNAKIPIICAMVLLCSEFLFFLIQLLKSIKEIHERWVKILSVVISIFGIVVSVAVIIEMTIELFQW